MRFLRFLCVAALAARLLPAASAQEAATERVWVEADRLPSKTSSAPFAAVSLDEERLRAAPQLRLDDILRAEIAGFSLFRRNALKISSISESRLVELPTASSRSARRVWSHSGSAGSFDQRRARPAPASPGGFIFPENLRRSLTR